VELKQGTTEEELARIVCYASALRIAQFHTRNEFSDWDAALHTFTFSNAVHQGLRWLPTIELLRGVFDAAMRIYLNRFLNIPPATIPKKSIYDKVIDPDTTLRELTELLDKQQRIIRQDSWWQITYIVVEEQINLHLCLGSFCCEKIATFILFR
jgi:hypothetical protein